MAALAWLLIPLLAAVGAAIWAGWAGRHRTTGDVSNWPDTPVPRGDGEGTQQLSRDPYDRPQAVR